MFADVWDKEADKLATRTSFGHLDPSAPRIHQRARRTDGDQPQMGAVLNQRWEFPKIRVPYFGVLIIRIFGNSEIAF